MKFLRRIGACFLSAPVTASLVLMAAAEARADTPLLLQTPTVSSTSIAFAYGDDLWIVPRAGGTARRLASANGRLSGPTFSPDGSQVAFTGNIEGNIDVYVVPAAGGEIRRLTYQPRVDQAIGWTPDGKRVLFASDRATHRDLAQLYTIPADGGAVTELPLPSGGQASFSPDGTHLAYIPFTLWQPEWKNYRGGQEPRIWIADLSDSSITKIPHGNWNDRGPMWVGDKLYFLSDRDGRFALYTSDTKGGAAKKLTSGSGFDIRSASAGAGVIVYDQVSTLHLYDPSNGSDKVVPVTISDDLPRRHGHYLHLEASDIESSAISPGGKRALFEIRGQILSVPASKGSSRNLTQDSGVANRSPAWSPDGKWVCYFTDKDGEYALAVQDPSGLKPARYIDLGKPGSFFYSPIWSPDSKMVAYADKRLNLWYVKVDGGTPVKVDTTRFDIEGGTVMDPAWSADSRWIAYVKQIPNYLRAVFVYSVESSQVHEITDGLSDAASPRFDMSGKYLYFTSSTNGARALDGLDMSSDEHPVAASVYAAVLRKELASPVAPESDEENADADKVDKKDASKTEADKPAADKAAAIPSKDAVAKSDTKDAGDKKAVAEKKDEKDKKDEDKAAKTTIDFDGLDQRIVALPMAPRNYQSLAVGKEGIVFATYVSEVVPATADGPLPATLVRFELKERKTTTLADHVKQYAVSADGEKILLEAKDTWQIADSGKEIKGGDGDLNLDAVEVWVNPVAEWHQIYHESWRIERDFFYDPHFHGLDIAAAEKLYAPFVDGIASREDLNVLLREMTGWLTVGHTFIGGGSDYQPHPLQTGLLGADFSFENGQVRIAKIYAGENWNPNLKSPLTQPGVKAAAGDYVLAVNGQPVEASESFYRAFEGLAGKQISVRLASTADGKDAHDETVVPLDSEQMLRYKAWIDGNRLKVSELSGGKLAYLHLPDTEGDGLNNFNRYFFAQVDKLGAVVDERFNHGGQIADYIVDMLRRPIMMQEETREGEKITFPMQVIRGPLVMLINQNSGSGGDALPWLFREKHLGPLVGTRTWGGLVGIGGYPDLIDGGSITAPREALYDSRGAWNVENKGVPPDVEVEDDPKLERQGHDPQLERAVEIALEKLKKEPIPPLLTPPYPDYHQVLPLHP